MHYLKLTEENFHQSENQGWTILKHKETGLTFQLRWNINNDGMMEFRIFDGERFLSAGAQYTQDDKAWIHHFIYNAHFNTWLQSRKLSVPRPY